MTEEGTTPEGNWTRKRRRQAERKATKVSSRTAVTARPRSADAPSVARSSGRHSPARRRLAGFLAVPEHAKKTIYIRTRKGEMVKIPMGPLAHDPTIRARVTERFNADPRLHPAVKAFLNDLASHSDNANKSVYGSQEHYAARAGSVRKTIYNRTVRAEKTGYLVVARCKPFRHRRADGTTYFGRKWTNRYWLTIFVEDFPKYRAYFAQFLQATFAKVTPKARLTPPQSDGAPLSPTDGSLPVHANAPPAEDTETSLSESPGATPTELFAEWRSLLRPSGPRSER